MNCPIGIQENAELLLAYCARRLDPESAAVLERHMEMCAECAAFRDEQRAVWDALDCWDAMPVSQGFNRGLYQRIHPETRSSWFSWLLQPFIRPLSWRPAFPIAAAAVVVVAGFVLEYPGKVVTPSVVAVQPRVEQRIEAEQVERTLEDLDMLRQLDLVSRTDEKSSKSM